MGRKKLTVEELEKKMKYHEKRYIYYSNKKDEIIRRSKRAGFKHYD